MNKGSRKDGNLAILRKSDLDNILVDDFPNFPFGGSHVIMNHGSAIKTHGP